MEHIEIKTEDCLYDVYEIPQDAVERTDDIFCGAYSRQSHQYKEEYDGSQYSAQSKDEKHRAIWLAKHCELLVSLYKEAIPSLGKTWKMKTKRKLWEHIAQKLREDGLNVSSLQVEAKWKNLKRAYNIAMAKKQSGQEITLQPYEKEFSKMVLVSDQELFSSGRQHEDTEENEKAMDQPMTETEGTASLSIGSDSPLLEIEYESLDGFEEQPEEQQKPTTIAEELRKLREEFAKERKEKRLYRNAKLIAYKKRTAVMQKQLKCKQELLKTFLKAENKQQRLF